MASFLGLFIVLFATTSTVLVRASNQFSVGDGIGWRQPDSNDTQIYTRWASKIRFQVGDTLHFQYKEDSVLVVDKRSYYHCNTTNPISSFNDGKTVFKLDRPGPFYFISGAHDHCNNGQRLIVDVITLHPSPIPHRPSIWTNAPSPSPVPSSAVLTISTSPIVLMALITLPISFVGHVWLF
ncbi:early nodulin-like protein 7 [Magnolia sinica]|uniref:early nodulin-like protein 7 n=1 Tax=Magnolia sinica TaxID=86752 RepID=UPI002658CB8A|nr:early nodulin-like protein 7 [Magnolia sinica]